MIIHYIIRKQIIENGTKLISDLHLYDILIDVDAFKYEVPSLKFVLKQTIINYGEKILSAYKRGLPATPTLCQYVKDSTTQFGFVENQARYAIESLAFGLGWIRNIKIDATSLNHTDEKSFELELEIAALTYHFMGMNITQIQGSSAKNKMYNKLREDDPYHVTTIADYDSYKNPTNEKWKDFLDTPQDSEMLNSLRWGDKTGVGIICGFNNIRAIDIDDLGCFNHYSDLYDNPRAKQFIAFDKFINKCLSLLHLPKDYEWVVRTGSGQGLHIIFRCEEVDDLNIDVAAFSPGNIEEDVDLNEDCLADGSFHFEHTGKLKQDFSRLELFWKGHVASPPSKGDGYDHCEELSGGWGPNPFYYNFINASGFLPSYEPMEITINDLNDMLNTLCGKVCSLWHEYNDKFRHFSTFLYVAKLENSRDSMGGYYHYKDTYCWLQKCTSPDGINSLGVWYVKQKRYEDAYNCFSQIDTDLAHYNLAEMILFGHLSGTRQEILDHFRRCRQSSRIGKSYLKEMGEHISVH